MDRPFGSIENMFLYVSKCRFFDPLVYIKDGLKANDRKRMKQRSVYREFVEEWLPQSASNGACTNFSRAEVVREALETFGQTEEYRDCIDRWRVERIQLATIQEAKRERRRENAKSEKYIEAWTSWLRAGAR